MSDESPHPLISVIIVNYNGKKFLSDCLNFDLSSDLLSF